MTKTESLKEYLIITLGLFINALGWTAFIIPTKIVGGGVSGVSALIYYITKFPVGISYFIMNIFLVFLGIKILGSKFGIKTIYGIIGASVFLSILQKFIQNPIVSDAFMSSIIGGALAGVGIGIVFTQGGSTGGTDIIAMIINKYKNISPGKIILSIDLIIIASSYFIFNSLEKIVYGYVSMAVTAYAIDMVLEGAKQSVQILIFSKDSHLIADKIGTEMRRGVTFLKGRGWYTKQDVEVLLVIVRKYELSQVFRIVKEIDKKAFISINSVMGVYGEGFDSIKT